MIANAASERKACLADSFGASILQASAQATLPFLFDRA
jgi:hypothetical protein